MFRSLWSSRNLLLNLVRRDLTVRYKSTVLGFFWSFAKPLAYAAIYMFVFGQVIAIEYPEKRIPSYALYVLAGILPWTFFIASANDAMHSILSSANLIKKVKLPLEVFPTSAVISQGVHFLLAMIVLVGAMLALKLVPGPLFLLLPLLIALQFILALGVALLLSALNVFYRDVGSIWEVLAAAWFYLTPIIYPANMAMDYFQGVGWDWARWVYLANPMTPIVVAYRRLLLYGALTPTAETPLATEISDSALGASILLAAAVSVVIWFAAHRIFKRLSRRFADEL